MSDVDIDIESDDDNDSDNGQMGGSLRQSNMQNVSQAEKRAHHNALERKRRDHIKESFTSLREAVPSLKGEKASRAQILKKTTECIQTMRRKIQMNQRDVEEKRQQNRILENQLRMLEKAKNGIAIDAAEYNMLSRGELLVPQDSSDDGDSPDFSSRSKKMKTSYQI